jgi:hypothetical protein
MSEKTDIEESRQPYENKLSFVKEMRIGRIEITREFIECARGDAWDLLMQNIRILRAEYDVFKGTITYDCYSPWFDAQDGIAVCELPTYIVYFCRDEKTGRVKVTGVSLVKRHTEYVVDDNVLERIRATRLNNEH